MTQASSVTPSPAFTKSERFNAADADIVFRSSDDVLFAIHSKNIETHTGGFQSLTKDKKEGHPITLSEKSEILDLLFQFLYPKRHPSLADESFEVLAPLADAAEKYEVFSAMNICHIRMLKFLEKKQHAEHIMGYASKHGYKEVADLAAPLVVPMSISAVVQLLPQNLLVPWMLYRQQWQDNLCTALSLTESLSVNADDAYNVVFCSSDGAKFRIHKKNLESQQAGFPDLLLVRNVQLSPMTGSKMLNIRWTRYNPSAGSCTYVNNDVLKLKCRLLIITNVGGLLHNISLYASTI